MASLRFEDVAHEAIATTLVLGISIVKALKERVRDGNWLTQKGGTWPGSVIIVWKKDQTRKMKNTWKIASTPVINTLSVRRKSQ
jgi:hypothetical protein